MALFSKIILAIVLVVNLAKSQGLPVMCTPTCVPSPKIVYVDQVAGSDSNPGTCSPHLVNKSIAGTPSWSTCAYATPAPVNTIMAAGLSVGLTYGSVWKDVDGFTASSAANHNLTFAAVGQASLGKPIFDGSRVVSSWITDGSGGYTATVNVSTAFGVSGGGTAGDILVLETLAGTANCSTTYPAPAGCHTLRSVTSQALCDSNAGSYYDPSPNFTVGGNHTICLHTSDSSDPNSNGNTYEVTTRWWAFDLVSFGGGVRADQIYNVIVEKQVGHDGALRIAQGSTVSGVDALWGYKHSMLVQSGITLTNSRFGACGGGNDDTLIHYDDPADPALTNTFTNIIGNGAGSASGTSCFLYDSHKGSGTFGPITITNATASNYGLGFGGQYVYSLVNSTCLTTVGTCVGTANGVNVTGLTSNVTGRDFDLSGIVASTIANSSLLGGSASQFNGALTVHVTGSTIGKYLNLLGGAAAVSTGNTFVNTGNYAYAVDATSTVTISDNNIFFNNASIIPASVNSVNKNRAAWKAPIVGQCGGTGCDLNSTFN